MKKSADIFETLKGGDRRSIGESDHVVKLALNERGIFKSLLRGMNHHDPLIAMRCADAVEKASSTNPDLLSPYKKEVLDLLRSATQPEVRWHIAQMVPRLPLSLTQAKKAFLQLLIYTNDRSSIVKTFAMQALHDLALTNPELAEEALLHIRELIAIGTPAMKARGKKLIRSLNLVTAQG